MSDKKLLQGQAQYEILNLEEQDQKGCDSYFATGERKSLVAGQSTSLTASLIRGDKCQENFFFSLPFSLRHTPPLFCLSCLSYSTASESTMDEIAPEYDVVVLGTGVLLPRHSTVPHH